MENNIIYENKTSVAKEQTSSEIPFASNAHTDTMGISCKPSILEELLSTVSLGNIFPETALNFEAEKAWWANRNNTLKNFGFIQKGFVDDCWGKGSVGFNAKNILLNLKHLRKYEKVTLLADPKNQTIYIRAEEDRIEDEFSYEMIPVENILTAIPEKPVIPKMNELYGADANILQLHWVVDRTKTFHAKHIPFYMNPNEPSVMVHLEYGTDQNIMAFVPSSKGYLKVPKNHSFEHIASLEDLKPVVKNYRRPSKIRAVAPPRDIVSLRFGDSHMYLVKKEQKGLGKFISGAMISTIVT